MPKMSRTILQKLVENQITLDVAVVSRGGAGRKKGHLARRTAFLYKLSDRPADYSDRGKNEIGI